MSRTIPSRPTVVILGTPEREHVAAEVKRIRSSITESAEILAVDLEFSFDFSSPEAKDVDLVIVVGGDGSILRAARQMGDRPLPVLGVNCGRLGFLAAMSPEEFLDSWSGLLQGKHDVVDHLMLQAELRRGGEVLLSNLALNEVAVLGGAPYQILEMDLYSDDVLATRYRCDGLIIATPIGSTAHNLSAGGPILRRTLDAVVISPISPHTLTYRPLVDSADAVLELQVIECNQSTGLVVDGQMLAELQADDRIVVRRAPVAFPMVVGDGHNDYRALREKLGWGGSVPLRGRR
ncbi:MAG: NAD(+)/NADH kinase [Planctomycetota bacterium]